jgi:nucleoside-diphosphate-sugar epimerase
MKVLYIGGTGDISYACVRASTAAGHAVSVFNRGRSEEDLPEGVEQITGDMNDEATYRELGQRGFNVVCQFLAYDTPRVELDLEIFGGSLWQYVFISSASAYQKPPRRHVITEDTALANPYSEYSRKKAAIEARLIKAHEDRVLPVTIVRPSHTVRRRFPGTFISGDHIAWRMRQGKPIISHGDGSSLWVLTHADDFASAFVKLLGNEKAIGEVFHITSDEANTWDRIFAAMGEALGTQPQIIHVPSDTLVRFNGDWAGPLLGDKSCSVIFDNSHVKSVTGGKWEAGISMREAVKMAEPHVTRRLKEFVPNGQVDQLVDRIIEAQLRLGA